MVCYRKWLSRCQHVPQILVVSVFNTLRYAGRSHFAHRQLWCLSVGPDRRPYEELRAAYNPVRPAGLLPAPPFEKWRDMSDICDHAYCRYFPTFYGTLLAVK